MLEPYPLPVSLRQEWHELLPHLTTEREFLDIVLHASADNVSKRLEEWARSAMLSRGDPIGNLVDYMARLCQGEIQPPPIPSRKSVTLAGPFPLPSWMRYEYGKLRARLFPFEEIPLDRVEPEYRYDVACQGEIDGRVSKWSEYLSSYIEMRQVRNTSTTSNRSF
jgi:hypothetical protein